MPATLRASPLAVFTYYTLDLPMIGVAVLVAAALFSAAEAGSARWAVGAGSVVFVVSLAFRIRDDPLPLGYVLGYESVSNIALIAAAIALGYGARARQIQAAQQAKIARLTEAQLTREADLRVRGERERLSRELHDTIGHALSVISLHAGVGTEAVGRDDAAAAAALDRVRTSSSRSLQELRSMVRILRSDSLDAQSRDVGSLSGVGAGRPGQGGRHRGTADIAVRPEDLSAAVDTAAYRVIQESLTNVIRHADATTARVAAAVEAGRLHVTITDDGHGVTAGGGDGYGITGLTERVRLLGGSLATRSVPGSGLTVEATIPARLPR